MCCELDNTNARVGAVALVSDLARPARASPSKALNFIKSCVFSMGVGVAHAVIGGCEMARSSHLYQRNRHVVRKQRKAPVQGSVMRDNHRN